MPFFGKVNFGLSTLTPQKKEISILFDNFEVMLWGAGGFECIRVAFESGFFHNMCLVVSLELQKTYLSGQKQKTYFQVQSTFSLENG